MSGRLWGDELKIGPFILKKNQQAYSWPTGVPQPYTQSSPPWNQSTQYTNQYVPLFCIFDTRDIGRQYSTGQGFDVWLPVCVCMDEASAAQVICALCMTAAFDSGTLDEIRELLRSMIPHGELAPATLDREDTQPGKELPTGEEYHEDEPRSVWDM